MRKFIASALVIAVISAGSYLAASHVPSTEPPIAQAQDNGEAPDFTLQTMDGEALTLSDLRGKVVVLNFWATWCPPCRYKIPYFIKFQEEFADDVVFVGVSLDQNGWDAVRPFAEELGINYPL